MDKIANGLRLAEKAHIEYEKNLIDKANVMEWPEFYAQWLVNNVHLWADGCSCEDGSCRI